MLTTLREAMAAGDRGGFAKALLVAYENPGNILSLLCLWRIADDANRKLLDAAFPGIEEVYMRVYHQWAAPDQWDKALLAAFPGLENLDKPTNDPHRIALRPE